MRAMLLQERLKTKNRINEYKVDYESKVDTFASKLEITDETEEKIETINRLAGELESQLENYIIDQDEFIKLQGAIDLLLKHKELNMYTRLHLTYRSSEHYLKNYHMENRHDDLYKMMQKVQASPLVCYKTTIKNLLKGINLLLDECCEKIETLTNHEIKYFLLLTSLFISAI